eukprot:COSAG05_NODE_1258_length_5358_cov_18.997718_2_plen_50_part_00
MKNRVAILAGVVWHQYANLVFLMFGSLKDYMICMAGSTGTSDLPVQLYL